MFIYSSESGTFNFLELHARVPHPKTPILNCSLTQALEPLDKKVPGADEFYSRFKRSVINWVCFKHFQNIYCLFSWSNQAP